MLREKNNALEDFEPYKKQIYIQNIEKDYKNLVSKNLDFKNCTKNSLSRYIL